MRLRLRTVEIVALAIGLSSCGQPKLRSVARHQATVEEVATRPDRNGRPEVMVIIHRDDCPSDRTRMTVMSTGPEGACLGRLAVGAHIEMVRAIYTYPLMSCRRDPNRPRSSIGGCGVQGVSSEQIGTPCPTPATAPSPPR